MDLVFTDAIVTLLLALVGDPVHHLAEPCQSLDVDVDQNAGPLSFVPLHRRFGLQVPQTAQSEMSQSMGDEGEGHLEQPRDLPEVQAQVSEMTACCTYCGTSVRPLLRRILR